MNVHITINSLANGAIEIACQCVRAPHSRPYESVEAAGAVLTAFGVNQEVIDAALAALPNTHPGHPFDVGNYEVSRQTLDAQAFTAVL